MIRTIEEATIRGKSDSIPLNLADIEITEMGCLTPPRFVDTYVETAYWKSTGRPLSESEIEKLNDNHPEFIHESALSTYY